MGTSHVTALVGPDHVPLTPDMSRKFLVLIKCVGVTSKERKGRPDESEERTNGPECGGGGLVHGWPIAAEPVCNGQVSNAMSVRHRTSCLSAVCVCVYMCVRVCKSPHL